MPHCIAGLDEALGYIAGHATSPGMRRVVRHGARSWATRWNPARFS